MGKPLRETRREAPSIANRIRYWAGMADKITGRQLPIAPGHLSYTVREPLGVVGVIVPWNGPMGMFVGRVSVALACGNGVVAKAVGDHAALGAPSCRADCRRPGFPTGLVNVVTGDGSVGALLAAHRGVEGLQFTGSVETGRKVATLAAPTFKQVVLELGGKAPNIVFADADLDAAARGTAWGVFSNTGQACVATSRLLVERSVAQDLVVERVATLARALRWATRMTPTTQLGPLASQRQFDRVCDYLELANVGQRARSSAARRTARGFYVEPTVLVDVDPRMRIAREEIFGPVLSVIPFDTRGRGDRSRERRRVRALGEHLDA